MKRIITIQADDEIYELVTTEAKEKKISMSALLRLIIMEHYNGKEAKPQMGRTGE